MAPLYVATLTVQREQDYIGSLPYLCTKNEAMAPLHVATLTVQREQDYIGSLPYLCTHFM